MCELDLREYSKAKKKQLSNRAERKNISCKITATALRILYSDLTCHYCKKICIIYPDDGNPLKHDAATLDRVNPLLGYDSGNVVIACHHCNHKKGRREEKMVKLARYGA